MAYNYGDGKKERINQSVKWALIDSFIVMAVFTAILELFPQTVLYLLDASNSMSAIGIPAVRLMAISFLLSAVSTIMSGYFQALEDTTYSLFLTLSRQVVLLIIFVETFSAVRNLELVWSSYIFAEFLAIPLAVFLYRKTKKKVGAEPLSAKI